MRILIDFDGVITKTVQSWLVRYNRDYFDNLIHTDIVRWDIHEFAKPECGMAMYRYLDEEDFFLNLEPMEGVVEAFNELLAMGHDVIVTTAAQGKTALYDKIRWLKKNIPNFDKHNVISAHRKDVVIGDLLLDDGPHNLKAFPGIACAFDQPWNQDADCDFRVHSWPEFVELVKDLEKNLEFNNEG